MITNHSRPCLSFCLNPSLPVALAVCLAGAWAGWAQPQPTVLTTLHGFGPPPDATRPIRPLSLGPDHALYGTTPLGGTQNFGAIFRLNRDGTGYSVLRSFSEADANGLFMPLMYAGLHVVCGRDQVLYGTSQSGSTHTGGIIFKLHTDGSGYTVLHSFDSMLPCSLIQGRDGTLYGAGVVGVFRIDPDGGNYALLRTFDTAVEGHRAMGRLWEASDGLLYGTCITGFGATNSHGTVFKLHPGGGSFEVIHTFSGSTGGRQPYAGVTEGSDGALYGATRLGGADGQGTIYKLQRDGTGFQVLHQFKNNGSDGLEPMGDLVQGLGQQLYGTTQFGGNNNQGTIYRINQDGSGYQVVHHFGVGLSPRQPVSGLITGPASDGVGVLYGASSAFGSSAVVGIIVNPPLSITPVVGNAGGQSVVFWPAWALNYQLQRTTNLTDGPWLPATNGVPVTGFQPTNTVGQEHYRLVWPH